MYLRYNSFSHDAWQVIFLAPELGVGKKENFIMLTSYSNIKMRLRYAQVLKFDETNVKGRKTQN